MELPPEARAQFAFFYVTAAYYASFCGFRAMNAAWVLELAALAAPRVRAVVALARAATFLVGYDYAMRTNAQYQFAWAACHGTALGIWACDRFGGEAPTELGAVARRLLVVLSHLAVMRGCGGPPVLRGAAIFGD